MQSNQDEPRDPRRDPVALPNGRRFPRQIWDTAPPEDREAFLRMTSEEIFEQWSR